jgi:hypothetical protein
MIGGFGDSFGDPENEGHSVVSSRTADKSDRKIASALQRARPTRFVDSDFGPLISRRLAREKMGRSSDSPAHER